MRNRLSSGTGLWSSVAAHTLLLLCIAGIWKAPHPTIARRLPGTPHGTEQLLTFSMGGAQPRAKTVLQAKSAPVKEVARHASKLPSTTPQLPAASSAAPGSGASGESALGDGNISIALVKFHPRPSPDLSALPHGTAGDVVLDATIDAQGRITDLKLAKGFGGAIDQTVIATVQQWTFAPATKDGIPVASEQEILFHYERS